MSVNNVNGGIKQIQGQANGKAQGAEKTDTKPKETSIFKEAAKAAAIGFATGLVEGIVSTGTSPIKTTYSGEASGTNRATVSGTVTDTGNKLDIKQ